MVKKILFISFLAALGFVSFLIVRLCFADTSAQLEQAKANVQSLIKAGNDADAQAAIDKIVETFSGNPELPAVLCDIAREEGRERKYEQAKTIYQQIMQQYPDSPYAGRARLGAAATGILSLTDSGQIKAAQTAMDNLITKFEGDANLPDALYIIAERFGWSGKYKEAKEIFEESINRGGTAAAAKAGFDVERMNVYSLIVAGKDNEALTAIDKLIADYPAEPRLAEGLYWISHQFEWTKGEVEDRTTRYNIPLELYQRLARQFPASSRAADAQWDYRRLADRTNTFILMGTGNQEKVDSAIEKMTVDFAGRAELVNELYWTAREYEEYPDKYPLSKDMYKRIMREYPASTEANQARLDISRLDMLGLIRAGDVNAAEAAINTFVSDFNDRPYSGDCLRQIAREYYMTGIDLRSKGQAEESHRYFTKARDVWQRIIDKTPVVAGNTDTAYFFVGAALCELERYEDAIPYFTKVIDNWPDYEYVSHAQYFIGMCYDKLGNAGRMDKSQAQRLAEEAYIAVVEKYPDSPLSENLCLILAETNFARGDRAEAALYYHLFLDSVDPNDSQVQSVTDRLKEVEKESK